MSEAEVMLWSAVTIGALFGVGALAATRDAWLPPLKRRYRLWRMEGNVRALALDTMAREARRKAVDAAGRGDLPATLEAQRVADERAAARDAVLRGEQAGALSMADAGPDGRRG